MVNGVSAREALVRSRFSQFRGTEFWYKMGSMTEVVWLVDLGKLNEQYEDLETAMYHIWSVAEEK
jgi:hypothetical protein